MANLEKRRLERLLTVPGQDLLARDFRDQAAIDAQLRFWHNRAEHGAYGVRFGLQAVPVPAPSGGPAAAVAVSPGLAYDAFGRELLLTRQVEVPLPALAAAGTAAPRLLTLRYAEYDGAAASPTATPCAGGSALADTGELAWRPADRLRPADGVPLARLIVLQGQLALDPDFRAPLAAPVVQPRFATGSTLPGGTAWTAWTPVDAAGDVLTRGMQLWIDTRAAGFTQVPCYFAWVQGKLRGDAAPPVPIVDHVGATFLSGFYVHVYLPLASSFSRGELAPLPPGRLRTAAQAPPPSPVLLARRNLSVWWLGIQMPAVAGRPVPPPIEVSDVKP